MSSRGDHAPTAVAIVASAGGVTAISRVLEELPVDLEAAVIVVMHLLPEHRSVLSQLLGRKTAMHVKTAENGDEIAAGRVYVAPPDVHLILDSGGRLRLDTSPPVHYVRPSADVLLGSLAGACGGNCMAVVLTGTGTDGAAGAKAVKLAGGHVLVQDPDSSEHGGMPRAAIAAGAADSVISLGEVATAIVAYVSEMNPN
jgi:two-component system chemotaxis response regulator CheB